MTPSSQTMESPSNPGRFSGTIEKDEKFIGGNPDKMLLAMLFHI
jgi:hypothetical protein